MLIELDERVTTVIGPSDVGKSSVVRALRWAALNVPVGCMIRDGAKQASVELIVDGRRIVRTRGSENSYSLDGQEYRAFRTDVPQDIAALLNLSDLNFQGQHDPLYWFSSTAGDVSRQLNAVVNLEIIDRTLFESTREVNRSKQLLETAEENLTRSVAERDGLRWVEEADAEFKKVEWIEESFRELQSDAAHLNEKILMANMAKVEAEGSKRFADDSERLLVAMASVGRASKKAAELNTLVTDAGKARSEKDVEVPDDSRLTVLAERAIEIGRQGRSGRLAELIRSARDARSARDVEVPDLSALDVIVYLLKARRDGIKNLKILLDEARSADEDRQEAARAADKAHEELESKTDGICPFCGKEMDR